MYFAHILFFFFNCNSPFFIERDQKNSELLEHLGAPMLNLSECFSIPIVPGAQDQTQYLDSGLPILSNRR